jgi:hypothetical protein
MEMPQTAAIAGYKRALPANSFDSPRESHSARLTRIEKRKRGRIILLALPPSLGTAVATR